MTGATAGLRQSEAGSDDDEGVPTSIQSSRTEASLPDAA